MSGWGLMDDVVIAGRDEQGLDHYLLTPLKDPSLSAQHWSRLSAIEASRTVTLRVDHLKVSAQQLVLSQTLQEMAARDGRSQLGYAALPLGLARAACRWMDQRHQLPFLARADLLRERALAWEEQSEEAVEIRCEANLLALHAAQAAVVAVGGAANQAHHPTGRLLREASFYFLTQLNQPAREKYLSRLIELTC